MCVACRERQPKKQLIRIVNNKDRGILVDLTGKVSGKGAYICKKEACLEKIQKTNFLSTFFEKAVDGKIYHDLGEAIKFERNTKSI